MGHFGDLPSQSLGLLWKKLNLKQQKQTKQKHTKSRPKSKENLNLTLCGHVVEFIRPRKFSVLVIWSIILARKPNTTWAGHLV